MYPRTTIDPHRKPNDLKISLMMHRVGTFL
jgi:hypothetical protein